MILFFKTKSLLFGAILIITAGLLVAQQAGGIDIEKPLNVSGGINMQNGSIVGLAAVDPTDTTSAVTLSFVLNAINVLGLADMSYINAALGRLQAYFNLVTSGIDVTQVATLLNQHRPRIDAAQSLVDSFTWSGSWGDKVIRDGNGSSGCIAVWGHAGTHSAKSSCKVSVGSSVSVNTLMWVWGPDVNVYGNVYGSAKAFLIDHPLKENTYLVHSSLEGPEAAVFYRGEGQLTQGEAVIELPEYFEGLTRKEERTVYLTPRFNSPNEPVSSLAASSVEDGRFKVWTTNNHNPSQKFYWKVKAVRGDIPPLAVETE